MHDALNVELPVALDAHPDLVTIWLAVDDLLAQTPVNDYAHDLSTLLTRLRAVSPHVRIVVANIPDLTLLPRYHNDTQAQRATLLSDIDQYNAVIAATAQSSQAILVDLYQQWDVIVKHPEYISRDGFHPSGRGIGLWRRFSIRH